jgi:predicted dehydrogenase
MTGRPHRLGIIINGATGGLATQQHLPALLAIRGEGGLRLGNGSRVVPDLLLVGRSESRLAELARAHGVERWTADLDAALSSAEHTVFFDAAATAGRYARLRRAIAAGKHVYSEKPLAGSLDEAMTLVRAAAAAGVRNGVVQDKLFLPGFRKLKELKQSGYFGRILELRLEFGRWIFDGETQAAQRPSWNYRKADGGGLILDMFPHWRYMLEQLVGDIRAVNCTTRTQVPRRRDEHGNRYAVDVEDAAFAQLEFDGGVIAGVNSSWSTRIRRDGIINIQIDGTDGSAVASPNECFIQPASTTPSPTISGARPQRPSFYDQWMAVPDDAPYQNGYRAGWEMFIHHVVAGAPFPASFIEGAKGLQLVELSHRSNRERRWIEVPPLPL